MVEKLPTQPYKGSRDFYPPEMRERGWMFSVLEKTVESFGYEKIDAPVIEPIDIYLAKTSEEIVSRQIYSFEDRGGRKVCIRPEMTPTVSRMVSAKIRELPRPIRWYSLPNLWRYEKPGKGRLREHWQLNADLFGASDEFMADVEILQLAMDILIAFKADPGTFNLFLNHRNLLNDVFEKLLKIPREKWPSAARILDKKEKISKDEYEKMLNEAGLTNDQTKIINEYIDNGLNFLKENKSKLSSEYTEYLFKLISFLTDLGYGDYVRYNPSVIRGFDYYTGMVFEIFDEHPENRRSLYGGGRYDNLISAFSKESLNAVGFGMGDVTLYEFLSTHKLIPGILPKTQIYVASFLEEECKKEAFVISAKLRKEGYLVETSLGQTKLGKQFQEADTKKIPIVIIQGLEEKKENKITVKDMKSGEQNIIDEKEILNYLEKYFN